jgi:hypothetical protein
MKCFESDVMRRNHLVVDGIRIDLSVHRVTGQILFLHPDGRLPATRGGVPALVEQSRPLQSLVDRTYLTACFRSYRPRGPRTPFLRPPRSRPSGHSRHDFSAAIWRRREWRAVSWITEATPHDTAQCIHQGFGEILRAAMDDADRTACRRLIKSPVTQHGAPFRGS